MLSVRALQKPLFVLASFALLFSLAMRTTRAATRVQECREMLQNRLTPQEQEKLAAAEAVVPVFGDVHGNVAGVLRNISDLQKALGRRFQIALQVGDLGFFPNEVEYKSSDPKRRNIEAGVQNYLTGRRDDVEEYYDGTADKLACKIFFVRGNHEDQIALREISCGVKGPVGAGPRQRLAYLPDGQIFDFRLTQTMQLRVAALGGIDPASRPQAVKRNPGIVIDPSAADQLLDEANRGNRADVLLTHQGPQDRVRGSDYFNAFCELMAPPAGAAPLLHLHGHGHADKEPSGEGPDNYQSYSLGKVPPEKSPSLGAGHAGLLLCNSSAPRVEFVPIRSKAPSP